MNAPYNLLAVLRPDFDAAIEANLAKAGVPPIAADTLLHYVRHGRPVGGFLTKVLEGDLFGAACVADNENRAALGDIARAIVWYFPNAAYGSREKVAAWHLAALRQNPALLVY